MAARVAVGETVPASARITDGPAVCVHANVRGSPSGSAEVEPSSVIAVCLPTVASGPASARGGRFVAAIATVAVPVLPKGSTTTSVNVYVPVVGGENVGVAVSAPESANAGPSACDQMFVRGAPSGSAEEGPSG